MICPFCKNSLVKHLNLDALHCFYCFEADGLSILLFNLSDKTQMLKFTDHKLGIQLSTYYNNTTYFYPEWPKISKRIKLDFAIKLEDLKSFIEMLIYV